MRARPRADRLRAVAVVAAAVLLAGLGVATETSHGTRAGFTASTTNSTNAVGTARYFQCTDAWAVDRDLAVFSYPLDESPIAQLTRDSFTGPADAKLQDHTPDTGGTWLKHGAGPNDAVLTDAGRMRKAGSTSFSLYRSDPASSSPNYTVSADVVAVSTIANDAVGLVGRLNTGSNTFTTGTYYTARYEQADRRFALYSVVDGTATLLGTAPRTLAVGSTTRFALDLAGSAIRVLVAGSPVIAVVDTSIVETGRPGLSIGTSGGAAYETTNATGLQLDEFVVQPVPRVTDSSGHTATGAYVGSMATSARPTASGCPRDRGGAYVLDGSTSYVTYPTVQTNPQSFSVETWFRTTTAGGRLIGFGDSATGASTASDRQVYVNASGQLVFGVRPRNVQTLTSAQVVTDGTWHHVAATFSTRTGLALYLDGKRIGSDPSVSSAQAYDGYWRLGHDSIGSGWPSAPATSFFSGQLRYAAVYGSVLTDDQVRVHFEAGR